MTRVLVLLCTAFAGAHAANVSFSSLFIGESVVLQALTPALVWGTADPGANVILTLDGNPAGQALSNASGLWEALLPAHAPSWHTVLEAYDGSSAATTVLRYGHVILCSGQSNMQLNLMQIANGTAEAAAAGAYTGRISLASAQGPSHTVPSWNGTASAPQWNAVSPGPGGTLTPFSGLCWLTGKAIFEALGGSVPVGLISNCVGGTPIETWLPPGVLGPMCPIDSPPCGGGADSQLWTSLILPFVPYTLAAVLWDQGERDVHCFSNPGNRTAAYPCMEAALVSTWRAAFRSPFAFTGIQLPGYLGDCAERNGTYTDCVPGVFDMRLAQAAGVEGAVNATVVPTYDLSCPYGVKTPECPLGSVHNINKTVVAARAARALLSQLNPGAFPPPGAMPPLVASVSASPGGGTGEWRVAVEFDAAPLVLLGTQYCVACCGETGGDFDVSADGGVTWVNGTSVAVSGGSGVAFTVSSLSDRPTSVRYTANQAFPQCAVTAVATGLPAMPFAVSL
jgi:hypothetical protein